MIKPIFNFRLKTIWVPALLLGFITACGSAPARQPLAIEQAKKADHEAHRALRDGDLLRARELFRKSMLMQQSLDNLPASAIAAINLSSVSHKLADDVTALELLDAILSDSAMRIPSELRAAAAFRKGIILADNGKTAEAEAALQLANQECNRQCAFTSGMKNLGARLALEKGEFALALSEAKGVISSNAEKEELANAQRIAAAAESAQQQHASALARYQLALELDKELGLSSRIVEDLKGIASVLEKMGRKPEAEIYARRAEAVISAARLLPGNPAKKTLP